MPRNYRSEYNNYQGRKAQIKNRALRNKARRLLIKKGRINKGDGNDVDHRRPLIKGGSGFLANLRVQSKSANRSFKRTRTAGMR